MPIIVFHVTLLQKYNNEKVSFCAYSISVHITQSTTPYFIFSWQIGSIGTNGKAEKPGFKTSKE
jgi:hypothetical protein